MVKPHTTKATFQQQLQAVRNQSLYLQEKPGTLTHLPPIEKVVWYFPPYFGLASSLGTNLYLGGASEEGGGFSTTCFVHKNKEERGSKGELKELSSTSHDGMSVCLVHKNIEN